MSPIEAVCVVERIHQPGWISDQDLEDAECMLSDMLESVQARQGTGQNMLAMSIGGPRPLLSPGSDGAGRG